MAGSVSSNQKGRYDVRVRAATRAGAAVLVAVMVGVLAGCGGGSSDVEPGTPTAASTASAAASTATDHAASDPVTVTLTEQDGEIHPDRTVVEARVGQPIVFLVTSDTDDEVHVHSHPDHEFEITPGKRQRFTFSIDTPGTVEVESHGLEVTVLKIEVRP